LQLVCPAFNSKQCHVFPPIDSIAVEVI